MKDVEFKHKRLLSVKEAAELLGLSSRWIYHRMADGSLPIIKLKGATRVSLLDLENLIEQGRQQ